MSDCGSPPGLGLGPSIFPTQKIYDTYAVEYTTVKDVQRPAEVKYYNTLGALIATVTITYDPAGDPIWNGDTLVGHHFNVFTSSFELYDLDKDVSARQYNSDVTTELGRVVEELQKINTYFAMMMDIKL